MKHQRAIDDAEKTERRLHILQSAASLFESANYDVISMQQVALLSGIAKGTVYLYFKTKEELALALLDDALGCWFSDLQLRVAALPKNEPQLCIVEFSAMLTESLQKQRLLLRLLPILQTILERNIPFEVALEFKRHLRINLLQTGTQIEGCLAFLKAGQGAEFLLSAYAALIGLQSLTEPSEVVSRVLQLPEMAILVVDWTAALRRMVSRLLTGILSENER